MRYLDVCAGISATSQAVKPLGWQCAGYSEIENYPCAVLEQRYGAVPVDWDHRHDPQSNITPLFGDFTQIEAHHVGPIDALFGGTPCQSFSVAGKRLGLDDPRGNLAIEFLALARRLGATWVVWENVPGVYSSWTPDEGYERHCRDGRGGEQVDWQETSDFADFLDLFRECGYRGGWRTLDAQYVRVDGFGRAVPQRRRRVFVVGHIRDGARARSVLFDRESMRGDPAPRREAGKGIAPTISARTKGGGGLGTDFDIDGGLVSSQYEDGSVATVSSKWAKGSGGPSGDECQNLIAFDCKGTEAQTDESGVTPPLRSMSNDKSHGNAGGHAAVAIQERAVSENPYAGPDGVGCKDDDTAYTLEARKNPQAVAFKPSHYTRGKDGAPDVVTPPLSADADKGDQDAIIAHPVAFAQNSRDEVRHVGGDGSITGALSAEPGMKQQTYVAYDMRGREGGAQLEAPHETANIRAADGGLSRSYIADQWAVRRLTPRECERLQGFPDDFTAIEWRGKSADNCPDGPRYKAIGNSMAVNVMRWLATRIEMVEQITELEAA